MIPFDEAYDIVMRSVFKTGTEIVSYTASLGRIIAGEVISDIDMPPFNKAAVDGFACRRSDLSFELEIVETIPAGKWPEKSLGERQCSKIMTGAALPVGADCVIMVEDTELIPTGKIKFHGTFTRENYASKGEDVRKGDIVIRPGKLIKPQDIAVMAAAGHVRVKVAGKPQVAVISSGSELVEPDEFPGVSQIRNSNASQLIAQTHRAGAKGIYYGIAGDNEEITYDIVVKALSESDIVLITGGVSMGDFDFIPAVLRRAGVNILFDRVAVQPGKPTTFGVHPKGVVFGLPGNPVSSFIQFEMLVRPLIHMMMGYKWDPVKIELPMKEEFVRRHTERMALVPVIITDDGFVKPVEYHGSAHISSLSEASGIITIPSGENTIKKGEIVSVRQI